jgi:hypothetical protein
MLDDSGITIADIIEVISYINTPKSEDGETTPSSARLFGPTEEMNSPAALLRHYEQTLAAWLLMGGINVDYDKWGW